MRTCGEACGRSWLRLGFGLRGALRRSRAVFESWRSQKRGALVLMRALLHFHFGEKHRRSDGGHGNLAAFRAADAIKHVRLVARGENTGERRERSANNVHA